MLHLFNIFHENKDSDNCPQLLEEECIRMFGTKYLNDEHDCNVVSMNSLNIHDANDMQSHKLGDAMFDEDDRLSGVCSLSTMKTKSSLSLSVGSPASRKIRSMTLWQWYLLCSVST